MDTIDSVRQFNRYYTRQIGLVGRNYVSGGLGLTELRVLYELQQGSPISARVIAKTLDLDEGYLSRILVKFIKNKWLDREIDVGDRRVSQLGLSASGRALASNHIDEARLRIGDMLADLHAGDQAQLVQSMRRIEQLLSGERGEITLDDLGPGDAGWLIQQHGEIYQRDQGFDHSFEALVAQILADYLRQRDPQNERAFIARQDGRRLGSIFCMRKDADTAQLRLFLLVPQARGLGLGKRLLAECLGFARGQKYRRMVLWTKQGLDAACALYEAEGFSVAGTENAHEFGVDLVNLRYELVL